ERPLVVGHGRVGDEELSDDLTEEAILGLVPLAHCGVEHSPAGGRATAPCSASPQARLGRRGPEVTTIDVAVVLGRTGTLGVTRDQHWRRALIAAADDLSVVGSALKLQTGTGVLAMVASQMARAVLALQRPASADAIAEALELALVGLGPHHRDAGAVVIASAHDLAGSIGWAEDGRVCAALATDAADGAGPLHAARARGI